jgi:hypothetical protein
MRPWRRDGSRQSLLRFGDDAAGDAGRRGARCTSCDGVNDDGGASVAENRVIVAAECDIRCNHGGVRGSIGTYDQREIWDVAGRRPAVAHVHAEMRPGRFEVRRFALGYLVNVQRMIAGRKTLDVQLDADAVGRFRKRGGSHALPLGILEIDGYRLECSCRIGLGHPTAPN